MDRVTLWDAFGAVKRGWVLFVFGLALTAAAVVAIGGTPGVYQSETRVVLSLPPAYQRQSPANQIGPTSGRLIPFAVVIETRINNGHSVRKATSRMLPSPTNSGTTTGRSMCLIMAVNGPAMSPNRY